MNELLFNNFKEDGSLEQLFGSKTRCRLLYLFFTNPDKSFFVRELCRILDAQIHAVRRELSNLCIVGIVSESPSGEVEEEDPSIPGLNEKKFFKLNTSFLLYSELRSLFLKSRFFLENEYSRRILEVGKIDYFVLGGVFTNSPTKADLFIVGAPDKEKVTALILEFEKSLGREINFAIFSPEEFRYRKSIGDKFLESILINPKIVIWDHLLDQPLREGSSKIN